MVIWFFSLNCQIIDFEKLYKLISRHAFTFFVQDLLRFWVVNTILYIEKQRSVCICTYVHNIYIIGCIYADCLFWLEQKAGAERL